MFKYADVRAYRLRILVPRISLMDLKKYSDCCRVEDWFPLALLGKNIDTNDFTSLVSALATLTLGTEETVNKYMFTISYIEFSVL
jgi:hypothetical protein